ncbi:VWA domain-containing protein [Thermaerobacter composti]|uniref:VWA domain-containing protein n=1 Tax=Thermaerobacter composti TaxID=554949 RepID=A0ABZ0QME0_9FIRM|nr:VWA domain-containing protein [Thermaerobacter composti]WPD18640.1 VWA domain-containing protein [Thermaerobacter composti]
MAFEAPHLLMLLVVPAALLLAAWWPRRPGGLVMGRPFPGRLLRGWLARSRFFPAGVAGSRFSPPSRSGSRFPGMPWPRRPADEHAGSGGDPGAAGARATPALSPARTLRALGLACVVLALANPTLPLPAGEVAVAVVVDRSASAEPALPEAMAALNQLLARADRDVQVAIISASGRAELERAPAPLPQLPLDRWSSPRQREATDLAGALRLAAAVLPGDARRRVVLLSDGRPTHGNALAEARALAAAGIRLDAIPLVPAAGADLAVRELRAPAATRPGRPVAVEVVATADRETAARLRLYAADALAGSRQVRLQPGENRFVFQITPAAPGPLPLRAEIEPLAPGDDAEPGNNRYHGVVEVAGARPVLLLTQEPDGALARALRSQGLQVDARGPAQRPADLSGWARYGAVILDDVPAHVLGERAMNELERFVHDLGGGLAMSGGPHSFGPGGYLGTAVERALPVHMDLRSKKNLPTVAVVLVVDRSGSMGVGQKLQMAVEAAARTTRLLTPKDRLGVVLFDHQAYVTREPTPVTSPDEVRAAFPSAAGGGTSVGAGLTAAWELIRGVQADVRHVIVLTDGVSEPFDVPGITRQFREAGVTLSAVAIGRDADFSLLRTLAEEGGGGFYEAVDPSQIPSLITQDAVLATRSFLVDRPFVPIPTTSPGRGGAAALLRGLVGEGSPGSALPPLGGYVATSPKEQADVLLVSDEDDPVLAAWRYGAGRAIAWTSDAGGRWAARWIGQEDGAFPRLWANAADWLLGRQARPGRGGPAQAGDPGAPGARGVEAEVVPATGGYEIRVRVTGSPPPTGLVRLVPEPGSGGEAGGDGGGAAGGAEGTGAGTGPGTGAGAGSPAAAGGDGGGGPAGGAGAPAPLEATLLPVAPDRAEARLPVTQPGVYGVAVDLSGGTAAAGGSGIVLNTAVAVPYPAEFRNPGPDPAYLESLAAVTGGRLLELDELASGGILSGAGLPAPPGRRPLWPYLLGVAALLLPLDVAARRLGLGWRGLVRPRAWRPVPAGVTGTAGTQGAAPPEGAVFPPPAHRAPAAVGAGSSPYAAAWGAAGPSVAGPAAATGAAAPAEAGGDPRGAAAVGTPGAAGARAAGATAGGSEVTARLRAARERSRARAADRVRRHVGTTPPGPPPGPAA